ncbi:MAG: hypothetical protein QGF46_05395 [Planctomycetota bacterium]|jgi:hypothetical protein|nr:hypothetical protein [Planctomycetota bacterium]
MVRFCTIALTSASLLIGCSGESQEIASTPTEIISAARGFPTEQPTSLARHFRMSGEITFHDYDDITQPAELWLSSANRMRFAIGGQGVKNIILLDVINGCWKKTPTSEFTDYEDGQEILAIETELRWFIMRMPWDNSDARFKFELSEAGLPSKVWLGETSVELSDYKATDSKGALYPTVWKWASPTDNRTETFTDIQDAVLYLDSAFVPPSYDPLDSIRLANYSSAMLADRIGIIHEDFYFLTEEDFTRYNDLPKGWWWTSNDKRYFVFEEQPDYQIENIKSKSGKAWLRWATYSDIGAQQGMAQIEKIATQTGRQPVGPAWAKEIKDSSRKRLNVFLIPIAANK